MSSLSSSVYSFTDVSDIASSRSTSPEVMMIDDFDYPYTTEEFRALYVRSDDGYLSDMDFSDFYDSRPGSPISESEHIHAPTPSLLFTPMDQAMDHKEWELSPLGMPLPLPSHHLPGYMTPPADPPVCGNCRILTPVPSPVNSRPPTPQLAIRSESMEKTWAQAVAIQAGMVGATIHHLHIPIRVAAHRVAQFIFTAISQKEIVKENPIDQWETKVPDEDWTSSPTVTTAPPSYPSSDDIADAASLLNRMSVSPVAPPPSPASPFPSSTPAEYNYSDDDSCFEKDDPDREDFRSSPAFQKRHDALKRLHSGAWFPNDPSAVGLPAQQFLIPNASNRLEDATYLRVDLDSKPPMIHATHGAGLPTFGRLLRPTPVEPQLRAGPYSPNQCRLFRQDEPFLQWVEDALHSLGDPSLTAGVRSYRQLVRAAQCTQDEVTRLLGKMGTQMGHVQEALTDLEQADAVRRIVTQILWATDPDNGPNDFSGHPDSPASVAFRAVRATPSRARFSASAATHRQRRASAHALKADRKKRCHHCKERGHIRRNCPNRA